MKQNLFKRVMAVCLCTIFSLNIAACGSSSSGSADDSTPSSESQTNIQEEPQIQNEQTTEEIQISFEEIMVVDNEECTIKITEIDPDAIFGYELKAYLENKSSDKTYMFSVKDAAVNGVQCDPLFATEVAAGKKDNAGINFSDSTLKENGITEFTDIEISFRVYDSNDWMADAVAEETIHVYPYGEENATVFVRESQSSDNIIVDNEYVTVIVTGYEDDSIWGYTVNLFFLNKTDKNVMFGVDEASVNGYMADPFYSKSVSSGKCAFGAMSWSDTTLEENGITEVQEIEFLLRAYDSDDWAADDFVNEVITLQP